MSSIQNKIVDAVFEGNDDAVRDLVSNLSYVKTRKILGLLESDEVTVRGNDIFVGGNTVGSFETKDDKIEFTASSDGAVKTFENDEELMNYVSGLTEDVTEFKTPEIKTVDAGSEGKADIKAPEGYDKHELASQHKDERMEKPKKKDHGHDKDQSLPSADSGSSSNPPDKEEIKSKHKDERMENPKKNDHGHDKKQEEPKASGGGSNPPDKETELKPAHAHDPKTKGHGHDDPSGIGKVEKKGK